MALTPGTTYTIVKPSFWRERREIRDRSNRVAGNFQLVGWQVQGEGEAHGRKLFFGYTGWNNLKTRMTDASGQVLGTIESVDWWGMKYKLSYGEKEYIFKLNGWGTTFTVYDGDTEVISVRTGGYFKPGVLTVKQAIEEKDAVALALFGLYQQYQINASAAAGGGGGAS